MALDRRWCGTSAKTRYPDQAAAETALRHLAMRARGPGVPTASYACPYCGGWHLTSREPEPPPRSGRRDGAPGPPRRTRPVGATVRFRGS